MTFTNTMNTMLPPQAGVSPLVAAVLNLPDMQGSGQVRELREAASIGTNAGAVLRTKLAAYAAATTRAQQMALLDDLVVPWGATSTMVTSIDVIKTNTWHRGCRPTPFVLAQANIEMRRVQLSRQ